MSVAELSALSAEHHGLYRSLDRIRDEIAFQALAYGRGVFADLALAKIVETTVEHDATRAEFLALGRILAKERAS